MANPPLRTDFTDSKTPGPNQLPAAEYNLNAQRTDEAYDYAQDGTATGEAIRTAVDQEAARAAIGAGTASTKTDVGLGNVDNTSDANKPVSTATQTALDGKVTRVTEYYDLQRLAGAACNGVTDDTAAWATAVAAVSAAGGGKIWWRGSSVASQIELSSKVGLCGLGHNVSRIIQKAGRAAGQHLILLDEDSAIQVTLQDFTIHGNKVNQTGLASAIYFINGGTDVMARHLIRNVFVEQVAGTGIDWASTRMRGSLIDSVWIYECDEYGFAGTNFNDNAASNMDIGRSGLSGVYLNTCVNSRFSNIKSWYSGDVAAGSPGFHVRNGNTCSFSNILTQENSGTGIRVFGDGIAVTDMIFHGLISDSDNTQATASNYGLEINNVSNSIFDVTVASHAPLAGEPYAGVMVTNNSSGNMVIANVDPTAVTWQLTGTAIGSNEIELCRSILSSTPGGNISADPYTNSEHRVTLIGNRTVNNPTSASGNPPVGLRFRFVFIQDATGGRTLTWSSGYKIPSSVTFDTATNTRTIIEFECFANADWVMTDFVTGIPA